MANSGKALGIIALLLAIGALGLGVFQIILPSQVPSEGPKIYVAQNDSFFWVDMNLPEAIPNLNITYNCDAGDNVLFEFTCQISLDIVDTSTTLQIYFEIDALMPDSKIVKRGYSMDNTQPIYCSGVMRHYLENSTAGAHNVQIVTYIDDDFSATYVRYCVLTVIVF